VTSESPESLFKRVLRMDEALAHILVAGGIVTLEELGYVPIDVLLGVPGLKESDAQLYRQRARAYLLHDPNGNQDDEGTVDA
jgi:transcription termination factor NusA